jgi:hypothetical protein
VSTKTEIQVQIEKCESEHARLLRTKLGACPDACAYADTHATLQSAWDACDRGDWMAWLLDHADVDKRVKVGCLADVAALVLPIYEKRYPNDGRVRNCIEVCRSYARGKASDDDLRKARKAASAYVATAAYDAAAGGAYVATAYASDATVYDSTSYASDATVYDSTSYALRKQIAYADIRKQIAAVIRAHFPVVPTF